MATFLIGELARRAGVNKETVRYYESKGLLGPPKRRESGVYREYRRVRPPVTDCHIG